MCLKNMMKWKKKSESLMIHNYVWFNQTNAISFDLTYKSNQKSNAWN